MRTIFLLVATFVAFAASCAQLLGLDDYQEAGGAGGAATTGGSTSPGGMGGGFGGNFMVGGSDGGGVTQPCDKNSWFFSDAFERASGNSWIAPDLPVGAVYSETTTSAFTVTGGRGFIATMDGFETTVVDTIQRADIEIGGFVLVPSAQGDTVYVGVRVRAADTDHYYEIRFANSISGGVSLELVDGADGGEVLRTVDLGANLPPEGYRLRAVLRGDSPVHYELYAWPANGNYEEAYFGKGLFTPSPTAPQSGAWGASAGSANGTHTFELDDLYACAAAPL